VREQFDYITAEIRFRTMDSFKRKVAWERTLRYLLMERQNFLAAFRTPWSPYSGNGVQVVRTSRLDWTEEGKRNVVEECKKNEGRWVMTRGKSESEGRMLERMG
jgi:hypothetical protein